MSTKTEKASSMVSRLMSKSFFHQQMIMQAIEEYTKEIAIKPAYDIDEKEKARNEGYNFIGPDGEMWKDIANQIQLALSDWWVDLSTPDETDDQDEDNVEMMRAK